MVDHAYIVQPPDLILIEVLEALPGRPISGERLVKPDGTVNLGFYGDIYVRGLTTEQIKVKLILHLRRFLQDDTLGLYKVIGDEPLPPSRPPVDPEFGLPPDPPAIAPSASRGPDFGVRRPIRRTVQNPNRARPKPLRAPNAERSQDSPAPYGPISPEQSAPTLVPRVPNAEAPPSDAAHPAPPAEGEFRWMAIHPADSDRVFVDVTAFNSAGYFVQGDVAQPGRLPCTGHETVLDALNYGGGLLPSAEPKDIRLVRPARGSRPARSYRVDLNAIVEGGDPTTNYQIFPNDRLIIGRNATVKSTIEIDRIAGQMQTAVNTMMHAGLLQRTFTQATSGSSNSPMSIRVKLGSFNWSFDAGPAAPALTPAQREAVAKEWIDLWWKASSTPGGLALDEKTFREAMMRAIDPAARVKASEDKAKPAK
jgi:protein involved in polysaccharide export with SLBB domain